MFDETFFYIVMRWQVYGRGKDELEVNARRRP